MPVLPKRMSGMYRQKQSAIQLPCFSKSLWCDAFQMKVRQDEEKQQLCSLRDHLKTALQLEQKEVKRVPLPRHCHYGCLVEYSRGAANQSSLCIASPEVM